MRHDVQIQLRTPDVLEGCIFLCWLVVHFAAAYSVGSRQAGNTALRADRIISDADVIGNSFGRLLDVLSTRVTIDKNTVAGSAPQQLVDRRIQSLAFDIPKCRVNGGNRAHRDGATAPVRALVKVLPDVFDPARLPSDHKSNDIV